MTDADKIMNPLHLGVINQTFTSGSVWKSGFKSRITYVWGSQSSGSQVHLALAEVWSVKAKAVGLEAKATKMWP